MLTPGDGGAPGVESRWHTAPRHSRKASQWLLERRRARAEPPQGWMLSPSPGTAGRYLLTRLTSETDTAAVFAPP